MKAKAIAAGLVAALAVAGSGFAVRATVPGPDREAPPPSICYPVEEITQETEEAQEERVYLGRFYITGYDTCARCCGKSDGVTASGAVAEVGRTCAGPSSLEFGTRIWIDGIGERTVEDRGGGIRGNRIDVLCADHPACYAVTGWYEVYEIIPAEAKKEEPALAGADSGE